MSDSLRDFFYYFGLIAYSTLFMAVTLTAIWQLFKTIKNFFKKR